MLPFLGFLLILLQNGNAGDSLHPYYHGLKKSKRKKSKHHALNCHCNCLCECPSSTGPSITPTLLPTTTTTTKTTSPSFSLSSSPSSPFPTYFSTPTQHPTELPTPSQLPTQRTKPPTTLDPTLLPSIHNTITFNPSRNPTHFPTETTSRTSYPTQTNVPTNPSVFPSSQAPSHNPTNSPTEDIPVYLYPLVMNMKGSSVGQIISFSGTMLEIQCYNISLYTLESKVDIGMANTCLTLSMDDALQEQRVELILETTSFKLPFGHFTSSTTPAIAFTNQTIPNYIVSTGSNSGEKNNTISRGQGIYENVTGTVRVSGFLEGNFTDASFYFDYIYVVNFDNTI